MKEGGRSAYEFERLDDGIGGALEEWMLAFPITASEMT